MLHYLISVAPFRTPSSSFKFPIVLLYFEELVLNSSTVDAAKKDPFCPVLIKTGYVTKVFLLPISIWKNVYPTEN